MKGSVNMKSCKGFIKGLGTGMAAGIAVAVAVKCVCCKSKKLSKRTCKMARAVSDIMDDIQEMIK